jgi:hypothetical protein
MGALTRLHAAEHRMHDILWLGAEGDDDGWVVARPEHDARGWVVHISPRTRLAEVAAKVGRALVMTPTQDGWLEQPCTASVLSSHGTTTRVLLCPAGPSAAVETIVGAIPRT